MSLRGFHIVFITLSVLCTVGFALWTILSNSEANTGIVQTFGRISGVSGIFLAGYGVWFYRNKLHDENLA